MATSPLNSEQNKHNRFNHEERHLNIEKELNDYFDMLFCDQMQKMLRPAHVLFPTIEQSTKEQMVNDDTVADTSSLQSQWLTNGRPAWAQTVFEVLLVEVNGLHFALPLIALGQIRQIDKKLTPLFGQADWLMGLQQSAEGSIRAVNTAKFVMPERYQGQHNYHYIITMNGLPWGLAVDRVRQPVAIDPIAIRWRAKRESRPWMAGMLKDHLCVLLDIPVLGDILQREDRNQ